MFRKPNFIILGATGRNSGKTEFACRLIKRWSMKGNVIGVKVTSVDCLHDSCPRGGKGCGVCSSLTENFSISEETDHLSGKDTSRMLQSGAKKVLWLKVNKQHLQKGAEALMNEIPDDALIVCESNTIRNVIDPGLFLVIKNMADPKIKESCSSVINLADKVIGFSNMDWDFSPEKIDVHNHTWIIKEKATAIILAGGKSSRMGEDKSLLPVNGKPLIRSIYEQLAPFFDEILIGE